MGIHVSPKEEAETENATEGAQIKIVLLIISQSFYKKVKRR